MIDGVAYQIKATDSVSYVDSVAEHIPVIATSEVAEKTDVIDGGYSNVEISDAIDLALGGSVIDVGDTILDSLTTGLGGVGIVAILQGTHSAWTAYQKTGDAVDALGVGLTATATGVARSAVNLAEMVYRGTKAVVSTVGQVTSEQKTSSANSLSVTEVVEKEAKAHKPPAFKNVLQAEIDFPSDKILKI